MLRAKFNAASTGANYVSLILARRQIREETLDNLRHLLEDRTDADLGERPDQNGPGSGIVERQVAAVLEALAHRADRFPIFGPVRDLLSILDDVPLEILRASVAILRLDVVVSLLNYLERVGFVGDSSRIAGSVFPRSELELGPTLIESARTLHDVLKSDQTNETSAVQAYRAAVQLPAIVLAAGLSTTYVLLAQRADDDNQPGEFTKLLDAADRLLRLSPVDVDRESLALEVRRLANRRSGSSDATGPPPHLERERVIVEVVSRLALAPRGRYNIACFLTAVGDFDRAFEELSSATSEQPGLRSFAAGDPSLMMLARHDRERWTTLIASSDAGQPSEAIRSTG